MTRTSSVTLDKEVYRQAYEQYRQWIAKDRWPFNQIKRLELNIFKFPADVFNHRIGG